MTGRGSGYLSPCAIAGGDGSRCEAGRASRLAQSYHRCALRMTVSGPGVKSRLPSVASYGMGRRAGANGSGDLCDPRAGLRPRVRRGVDLRTGRGWCLPRSRRCRAMAQRHERNNFPPEQSGPSDEEDPRPFARERPLSGEHLLRRPELIVRIGVLEHSIRGPSVPYQVQRWSG